MQRTNPVAGLVWRQWIVKHDLKRALLLLLAGYRAEWKCSWCLVGFLVFGGISGWWRFLKDKAQGLKEGISDISAAELEVNTQHLNIKKN